MLATDHETMRIAERQMRNWELAHGQRLANGEPPFTDVAEFVCLSRDVGAGATEIAQILADRLRWPVFDKEILHIMAGDDAFRERLYDNMDERDLSWCEETLRAAAEPGFVRNDYFHKLCRTVLMLARKGSAVFIGRGADLILPRNKGVRIRLIAPRDMRLERLANERRLSAAEASAELSRLEQERTRFIHQHFGPKADAATRYDLVINLARITPGQAAELILAARLDLLSPP